MTTTTFNLFAASFIVVAALGLQQINVERRSVLAAALMSPLIGASNWVMFKALPGPTTAFDFVAYLAGGSLGIAVSIWFHPIAVRLFERIAQARVPRGDVVDSSYRATAPDVDADDLATLAVELADEVARSDVESYCSFDKIGRFTWYNTADTGQHGADVVDGVAKAVRYLELRAGFIRHPQQRNLVRFEG